MRRHKRSRPFRVLETLESRTLFSVVVNAAGNSATFTDVDGDLVTVKISKGTFQQADFQTVISGAGEYLAALDLSAENIAGANLTISATKKPGGNGLTNVGYIDAGSQALGVVSVAGDLGRIDCGNDTTALKSLSVRSMGRMGADTQLGNQLEVLSTLRGATGSVSIKGDMYDCEINFIGNAGPVTIGGSIIFGVIYCADNLGLVKVAGDVIGNDVQGSGVINASDFLGGVTIGGSLIGGSGNSSGAISGTAGIGPIKIGGSVVGAAGNDSGRVSSAKGIAGVTIGGSIIGAAGQTSGFVDALESMGNVTIGGSIRGGNGLSSGELTFTSTGTESIKIAHDIVGGVGSFTGEVITGNLKSFTLGGSIIGGENTTGLYTSGYVRIGDCPNIKIAGDLVGSNVSLSGVFVCLNAGSLTVGGSIIGGHVAGAASVDRAGYLQVTRAATLTINGSVIAGRDDSSGIVNISGAIYADESIGTLAIKGNLLGNVSSQGDTFALIAARGVASPATGNYAIKTLKIGGNVELAQILAGYSLLAGGGGASIFTPTNTDVQINSITVTGDWAASSAVAGAKNTPSGNLDFGNSDDDYLGNGNPSFFSAINSITITGELFGSPISYSGFDHFGFVAQKIGAVKINGESLTLNPAVSTDDIAIGPNGDFNIHEV